MKKLKEKFACFLLVFLCAGYLLSPVSICSEVWNYHGIQVHDPYAWLEDMEAPNTLAWIAAQNETADHYFESLENKEYIRELLKKNSQIECHGIPDRKKDILFFTYRGIDDDKTTLRVQNSLGEKRVLIDPDRADGINPVLSGSVPSGDGEYCAYCLADCGSDVLTWKFIHVPTGKAVEDVIEGVQFSAPAWSPDGKGVYYILQERGIYFHELGSEDDSLICHSKIFSNALVSALEVVFEGKALLFSIRKADDQNNGMILFDLNTKKAREILAPGIAHIRFVGEAGGKLYFISDSRLVACTELNPLEEVIPEKETVLFDACATKDYLVCCYLKDCVNELELFDLSGSWIKSLPLCGHGCLSNPYKGIALSGHSDDNDLFCAYTDFKTPAKILKYDLDAGSYEPYFTPSHQLDKSVIAEQVFVTSQDGVPVPMFLTYKRGIKRNGKTPTLLYGYGGFNLPILPSYSPLIAAWVEMGGLFASVNLRGGGEYGKKWHEAGMLGSKQNVFDDFIAAAEWLIDHRYTSPSKLAINGRSNGGLLVGACLVQRPGLFGAAIPQVGVHDMLRFHKFTVGWAWKSEYGDPENPEHFPFLYAYSPYHNVKNRNYPAVLITTADHDDRVVPLHSTKFAARLMNAQQADQPILLRVYQNAAHGTGASASAALEENVEILTFLYHELKMRNH